MDNTNDKPQEAIISWHDNGQPYSKQFEDVYFSAASGIEESRYVFLEQNKLDARWQQLTEQDNFIVLETGFGTGLNFLNTWQRWNTLVEKNQARGHLHFISIEKFPLNPEDLQRSLALWPELAVLGRQLLASYPPTCVKGLHKMTLGNVSLTLYFGDILDGLAAFLTIENASVNVLASNPGLGGKALKADAIYLDGFAPANNPEMWSDKAFSLLARLSRNNTHFSTFTAAGFVKRGLQSQGFSCEKVQGFGRKREMLRGTYITNTAAPNSGSEFNLKKIESSWHLVPENQHTAAKEAIVIGGGLAGCHLAFALAKRGIKVRLLEKNHTLAQEASGNKRGVIYTRLSPHAGALSEFNLRALLFSCQFYEAQGLFEKAGRQSGVLHLATSDKEQAHYLALEKQFAGHKQFLRFLNAAKASSLAGIKLENDGLLLAKSGWLDPVKVCEVLCEHENIDVLTDHAVESVQHKHSHWQLEIRQASNSKKTGIQSLQSPLLFIANAIEAKRFSQSRALPLKKIRGQVSYCSDYSGKLPSLAICAEGYVTTLNEEEQRESGISFGASFNLHDESSQLTTVDHDENLQRLLALSADFSTAQDCKLEGNVGFRCTSQDYFPIVGPLPQESSMRSAFASLSKRARAPVDSCGIYEPNLYCLLALGSRGLAYAPLVADALASAICAEPLPLPRNLWCHIHPARFLIRNLIRNQAVR